MGQLSKKKQARRSTNLARSRKTKPTPKITPPSKATYSPEFKEGDDKVPEVSPEGKAALSVARAMHHVDQVKPAGEVLSGKGFSDEDQVFESAEQWARQLLKEERFASLFGAIVNVRRTYAILYRRLQKLLETVKGVQPLTEDFLIQAAMFKASLPFDAHDVMEQYPKTVLRTIADIIDEDTQSDNDEIKKARREADEARKQIDLSFPFALDDQGSMDWPRKTTLVLAGWRPAIRWIADQIANHILANPNKFAILRLREDEVQKEDLTGSLNLHVGSRAWQGCCNTHNDVVRMIFDYGRGLAHLPDLILCENMALAYTKSFTGRRPGAVAGDAHKIFRKWCDENGCGLLGLLPSSTQEPPDTTAKEYEQLRTFTVIRRVTVTDDGPDMYRLQLPGTPSFDWVVEKKVLDEREKSKLIVPDFAIE